MGVVVKANVGSADIDLISMVRAVFVDNITEGNIHAFVMQLILWGMCQMISTHELTRFWVLDQGLYVCYGSCLRWWKPNRQQGL